MGAIPTQRETAGQVPDAPGGADPAEGVTSEADDAASGAPGSVSAVAAFTVGRGPVARVTLPSGPLAPGAARRLVRDAFAEWTTGRLPGSEHLTDRLAADALVVVSELVTDAVLHAGTEIDLVCRLERDDEQPFLLVVEVHEHDASGPFGPPRAVPGTGDPHGTHGSCGLGPYDRGPLLMSALSVAWGTTYRTGRRTVWARLLADRGGCGADGFDRDGARWSSSSRSPYPAAEVELRPPGIGGPEPQWAVRDRGRLGRGALTFLAEASELLAGQLDEEMVAALTGRLLVPRLADWGAIWLEDEAMGWGNGVSGTVGPRLARVWHGSEHLVDDLRGALEKEPPPQPASWDAGPVTVSWPAGALGPQAPTGAALAYPLTAGGRPVGTLVIGRVGGQPFPEAISGLVEDFSRRVALAIGAARQYARQVTISSVLQRGLLPGAVAEIPGVRSALVHQPCDQGGPSGDFYDLFPAGDSRWCFAIGDVQGKGPEAAVVIGLARPWLRLLAREGYGVADVLDRLNQLLLDDATEAADAAARALVAAGGRALLPGEGPQNRFLSLLYGELVLSESTLSCTIASAGHPLPLLLEPSGAVRTVAEPQTLLGVVEDATYSSQTCLLRPGDSLLCVTDGVTERRRGPRQFDDDDGLALALAGCVGLSAQEIAERIEREVHEFSDRPPEDDLALLVLQAVPEP